MKHPVSPYMHFVHARAGLRIRPACCTSYDLYRISVFSLCVIGSCKASIAVNRQIEVDVTKCLYM